MVNDTKLQFNAANRYEYIAMKGSITAPIGVGGASTSFGIIHGLGYVPFARLWVELPNDPNIYPVIEDPNTYFGTDVYQVFQYSLDTQNVNLTFFPPLSSTGGQYTVYYRIYAEPQQ